MAAFGEESSTPGGVSGWFELRAAASQEFVG
jgi:hypothetical protein